MTKYAKNHEVNIYQAKQRLKPIMDHGIHLALFIKWFVNNVHIDKDEEMASREKRPPPLVLAHPTFLYCTR